MMLAAFFGAVVVAALPVQVESAACPSGGEVEQALATMLPPVNGEIQPYVAHVQRQDKRLHVELVGPDAVVIAERWIDDSGACLDLAELIAVVIASWESDVHPAFTRPHAEPVPVPVPEQTAAQPVPSAPAASAFYEVGAGAALSWSGSTAAAGILAASFVPFGAGPGLHLSAAVESARALDLAPGNPPGQATWRRWTGNAEFDWRLPRRAWALDFHGGLAFGWLAAKGVGFSENSSGYSFSSGGVTGARVSRQATRHISVWLELTATYWPRKQLVYAQPNADQQEIPHYQGLATIGLSIGRFPSEK
jgi:hypothetical protein